MIPTALRRLGRCAVCQNLMSVSTFLRVAVPRKETTTHPRPQASSARDSALLAKGDALALRVSVAMLPRKPLNGAAVLRWMLGAARAGRMGPAEDRVRVLG